MPPLELERKLKKRAAILSKQGDLKPTKPGVSAKEAQDAYVYGTLQKVTSWKPGKK